MSMLVLVLSNLDRLSSLQLLGQDVAARQLLEARWHVNFDDVAVVWIKHLLSRMAHDSLALSY